MLAVSAIADVSLDVLLRGSAADNISPAKTTTKPKPSPPPGPPCWKQVFPQNHVFLNTLDGSGQVVQMGYISSTYDGEGLPSSGQPVMSIDLAEKLCDAMNTVGTFCAGFQYIYCANPYGAGFLPWVDLLTPLEFNTYYKNSGQNINSTYVSAVAYAKLPCAI